MQKRPISTADLDRQLAEYERQVRAEMIREVELAELAQRQRLAAEQRGTSRRFLPIVKDEGSSQLSA
jgi:hypothetical protein